MLALTEQSVFTCLLLARPSVHILLNSPVTANAAVASPSTNAPASADVTNVLFMGRLLWGFRHLGSKQNAWAGPPVPNPATASVIGLGDHPGLRRHFGAGIGDHGGQVGRVRPWIVEAAGINPHVLVDQRDAVVPFECVGRLGLGLELLGQVGDLGL